MKNAIIFDHDGTLVDSLYAVEICTNNIISRAGFEPVALAEIKKGMAYPTAERFSYHTGEKNRTRLEEMSRDFYLDMHNVGLDHLKLYGGILKTLDALAQSGFSLGMVTNNQGLFVRKAAARLSYAYDFEVILGEENVPRPKPDPSGLLQACAGMGAVPGECWDVGDGKPDFDAARAAGMKCALVSWGAHPREELERYGADAFLHSPEEMKNFFLSL